MQQDNPHDRYVSYKWFAKWFIVLIFSFSLLAQTGLIRIRITDAMGNVIPQAEVTVSGKGEKALVRHANRLGQVAVSDLSAGSYNLKIEAPGYVTKQVPVDLEPDRATKLIDVRLESISSAASEKKRN